MSEQQSANAAVLAPSVGTANSEAGGSGKPAMPLLERVGRNTATALVRAALLFITLVVVVLSIGPVTGRYRTLTVLSGSMRPWMKPGDVVVDTPMRARDVRKGDIITYHLPGANKTLVTHRVLRIVAAGDLPTLQTQGDANNAPDPVAHLDEPRVWRARVVVPKVGWALTALRTPKMRLVGSVLAPILLLGVWLLRIWGKQPDNDEAEANAAAGAEAPAPADLAEVVS